MWTYLSALSIRMRLHQTEDRRVFMLFYIFFIIVSYSLIYNYVYYWHDHTLLWAACVYTLLWSLMILVSVHFPLHIYEHIPIIRLCVMWFTLLQKNHSVLPFLLPDYLNDQTQMICLMCLPHLYTLIQREYICVLVGQI